MKVISLLQLFSKLRYDWTRDSKKIKLICNAVKETPEEDITNFRYSFGDEKVFLAKASGHYLFERQANKLAKVFHLGTDLGAYSYAISLTKNTEEVLTTCKKDAYNNVPHSEKEKIIWETKENIYAILAKEEKDEERKELVQNYDFCFMNGGL